MALLLRINPRSVLVALFGLAIAFSVTVVQAQDIDCGDEIVPNWPEDKDIFIPVYSCSATEGAIVTTSNTDFFFVQPADGSDSLWNLYFLVAPDFEKEQSFMVTLTASNPDGLTKSSKVKQSSAQLLILLEDADDNYPLFQGETTIKMNVLENVENTSLVSLSVSDADGTSGYGLESVKLSFEDPSLEDVFTITSPVISGGLATVEIGLKSTLDFETMSVYNILVVAEDGGGLNQTATIIINVVDAEDMPPYFTKIASYTSIPEDAAVGTVVFTVQAVDGDVQLNYSVTYSITNGNTGDAFAIDKNAGSVSIAVPLDSETALYTLTITATEGGTHTDDIYVADTTCTVSVEPIDD